MILQNMTLVDLENEIELTRVKLQCLTRNKINNLVDPEVINVSRTLDELIVEYIRYCSLDN